MKYRKGYKYQLAEDEVFSFIGIVPGKDIVNDFISLFRDGMLIIHKGYAWDGPSGPTIDRKTNMRGSLAHDALYQLMREGLIERKWRLKADELIKKCWIEDGMYPWLAAVETKALNSFAAYAADPRNTKEVYEAP